MNRLPPLHPAVANTRRAVRRILAEVLSTSAHEAGGTQKPLVLVALSGGADSLALAAATAFEAPKQGVRAGAIIIDHGLQAGSAEVAQRAAAQARSLGLEPVTVRAVHVAAAHSDGPEAAARYARYAGLEAVRQEQGAHSILTAHTRDDQAEQVLLGLARGSGVRALAGIPPQRGALIRPFLQISRSETEAACAAQSLQPWHDPHNRNEGYTRVRVRRTVMPVLERELGSSIRVNLARTAELARADAEALDQIAAGLLDGVTCGEQGAFEGSEVQLWVARLREQPAALASRVVRQMFRRWIGVSLTREHTLGVLSLVTDWRGQGPIQVPGATVVRKHDRLVCTATGAHASQAPTTRLDA